MKNKKGQMEFDPIALVFGLAGAGLSLIISKNVELGMFWKIMTPIATGLACYFYIALTGD